MNPLSLHHLILPELSAVEFVELASDVGCEHVCLFTQAPADAPGLPTVRPDDELAVWQAMADRGITAYGITSFLILPHLDVRDYTKGLERGARLGAVVANVRLQDHDIARASDTFARFGALCAPLGITPCIEFTGYRSPGALAATLDILHRAGCGAVTVDALHMARTGIAWEELEALPPQLIGYVQLCDGPLVASAEDYKREGPRDRLAPGEGEFSLERLMKLIPQTQPVSLEVPALRLRQLGLSPSEIASTIVSKTRSSLCGLPHR